jgi:hypothetical protein
MNLNLPAAISEIEKTSLPVPPPPNQPPGNPVPRLGLHPGSQPLMRRPNLSNVLLLGKLRRKRIDPSPPQPLKLLPPVTENIRNLWSLSLTH